MAESTPPNVFQDTMQKTGTAFPANSSGSLPHYPQDISGTLNVSAALSASSALKLNQNGKDNKIGKGSNPASMPTNPVLTDQLNVAGGNSNQGQVTQLAHGMENTGTSFPADRTNLTSPLGFPSSQSEAFIDGIEKFVDFVSKEGLVKSRSEKMLKDKPTIPESGPKGVEETRDTADEKGDNKNKDNSQRDKHSDVTAKKFSSNKKINEEKVDAKEEDVDADLKSYALAVNDMLDNEAEVANNNSEIDAEIKTVIVSNDDGGDIQMTFTDNAVGRFETIGKNDDKGAADPMSDGLSILRKSNRPKKRKVYADFDLTETSDANIAFNAMKETGKEVVESNVSKASSSQGKSKRKNPSPKKAKLTVEEVYESDSNEESDGNQNQATLKVRMAKCEICQRHFLDRKKLEEHKKRHTQKPVKSVQSDYPCIVCGKVFFKREHWRRHIKIHDDVRPYSCPVCKKGFRRKEHVKRHMLIHTGEKPFQCDFCLQHYQRADHLKKHLMQHEKGTYRERRRKGTTKSRNESGRRRKPSSKAAKLVAQSRKSKAKNDDVEDEEEHYSDGLSDEDTFENDLNDDDIYAE